MVKPLLYTLLSSTLTIAATVDDFIDVIMKDHRKYIKW